jgi:DNA polymerase
MARKAKAVELPFVINPTHPWELYPAGTQVIAHPGFATVYADFDCETYSEAGYVYEPQEEKWISLPGLSNQNRGLKAVGARNYVQHPTFEVLSWAWNLKDGKGARWWRPGFCMGMAIPPDHRLADPRELCEFIAAGGIIEAFNVGFEWCVWTYYCVPKFGWPPLSQMQVRCCAAKARAAAVIGSSGGLDDLGKILRLHEQKDPAGDKLIRKLTVPQKKTKANQAMRWTPLTAHVDFERFYSYNLQDIRTEAEASIRLPDLSPRELGIWRFDLRCNTRGMQIDLKANDDCIAVAEQAYRKNNAELQRLTNYHVNNSSEVAKLLAWMSNQGVTLFSLDEEALEAALLRTDYPPAVQRALQIRQILAYGSVKKLWAFRSHTTAEGRLCDQYVYHGAHTSLWNGRAVQPANLYTSIFSKPEEAERALAWMATRNLEAIEQAYPEHDALEVIASCLRSLIIAAPGHRLISADFTAIQAVATSALAGEEWRLEVFRTHGRLYETMASLLTGKPLQFYIDYKKQNGKHHKDRQDYGKIPVLSADFGAWLSGWKRFGADKLGDDRFLKDLILKTRATIPNIVEFWGGQTRNKFNKAPDGSYAPAFDKLFGLEGAAISAVLEPGRCFGYRGIAYQVYEDVLYCMPPSGGLIRYHAPRLDASTRPYSDPWELELTYEGWNSNATKGGQGWCRMKLYGGVCTQNVVSHMCRQIQADSLLALENNGYPIVMHTHDEGVAEVPYGYGSKEHYTQIVRDSLPAWAVDLNGRPWPIKVPMAWEFPRYGKWED